MQRVSIGIQLPHWLYQLLRRMRHAISGRADGGLNLWGDRDVEFSFIAAHLPLGPGRALDFGCGANWLSMMAAQRGFEVTAVDLEAPVWPWRHAGVKFVQGDFLKLNFPPNSFDLIINCSAVEHVGLSGRYGVSEGEAEGDLRAMERMRAGLSPGGMMLLTVPCGRDAIHAPLHRIYGTKRLPRLLAGYNVERESFWVKDAENRWVPSERKTALEFVAVPDYHVPHRSVYALGCFVLRKSAGERESH